ncbi:mycothiol synthase [Arthrobacter sp. AET 35A]|uniref:mycothiol synthase n=1 Tax=Arthrobacter sp. AET 35A TaxID=2292643 RepID=UPI001782B991|nr:mycothiol synthase [Arthrobacter sp. AET 35A]MBE0011227.1 mycothiol synthase [Arthrobacter sp. AET 35A]
MTTAHVPTWPILRIKGAPEPRLLQDILGLAAAAAEADGNPPLSEQTLVNLRTADAHPDSLLVFATYAVDADSAAVSSGDPAGASVDAEELAGVAVVSLPRDEAAGQSDPGVLELVVRPTYRSQGVGTALADAVTAHNLPTLRAWSHGNHAAAVSLAAKNGFEPVRELWRMRQTRASLEASVLAPAADQVTLPDGVVLRAFQPGVDEQAWLAANRAAFVDHAEQGATTLEDLQARMAEDWFDPAGFLLAVRESDGQLLGFHWTKVHPRSGSHPAMGEVYVVGVTPEAQGMGLGKALTIAGIEHLHAQGLQAIMLYVDADNTAAVALYRKLGFTRWDVDVMYAPRVAGASL